MQNEREREFAPASGFSELGEKGSAGGRTEIGGERMTDIPTEVGEGSDGLGARAKEKVSSVGHRAIDQVESQIEHRKERAATSLGDVAQTLRSASHQLSEHERMAHYMERAADRVDELANFLNSHDVAEMVDDIEDFARRQPAVFVGGAFALGMLGARFLKSSRRHVGYEGPMGGWSTEELTSRVEDPRRDAIARPNAPGYAPPEQRGISGSSYGDGEDRSGSEANRYDAGRRPSTSF
jgi:hypothetical protein